MFEQVWFITVYSNKRNIRTAIVFALFYKVLQNAHYYKHLHRSWETLLSSSAFNKNNKLLICHA
jgi:hypothetical protein